MEWNILLVFSPNSLRTTSETYSLQGREKPPESLRW